MDSPPPIVVHSPPALAAKAEPGVLRQPTVTAAPAAPPVPRPAAKMKVAAAGYHVHACPYCHAEWSHSDESKGDLAKHTCPDCGKVLPRPWYPSQRGTSIVTVQAAPARPPVRYAAPAFCPPGGT